MVLLDNDGVRVSSFLQLLMPIFVVDQVHLSYLRCSFVLVPHPAYTSSSKDENIRIGQYHNEKM